MNDQVYVRMNLSNKILILYPEIKNQLRFVRMNKEKTLAAIRDMPQEFDVDELIERILFIDKVEKGIKEAIEGKTIPHEEVKKIVQSWSK